LSKVSDVSAIAKLDDTDLSQASGYFVTRVLYWLQSNWILMKPNYCGVNLVYRMTCLSLHRHFHRLGSHRFKFRLWMGCKLCPWPAWKAISNKPRSLPASLSNQPPQN